MRKHYSSYELSMKEKLQSLRKMRKLNTEMANEIDRMKNELKRCVSVEKKATNDLRRTIIRRLKNVSLDDWAFVQSNVEALIATVEIDAIEALADAIHLACKYSEC